jgi:hypothetical protein
MGSPKLPGQPLDPESVIGFTWRRVDTLPVEDRPTVDSRTAEARGMRTRAAGASPCLPLPVSRCLSLDCLFLNAEEA